jgi:hypothetical protein
MRSRLSPTVRGLLALLLLAAAGAQFWFLARWTASARSGGDAVAADVPRVSGAGGHVFVSDGAGNAAGGSVSASVGGAPRQGRKTGVKKPAKPCDDWDCAEETGDSGPSSADHEAWVRAATTGGGAGRGNGGSDEDLAAGSGVKGPASAGPGSAGPPSSPVADGSESESGDGSGSGTKTSPKGGEDGAGGKPRKGTKPGSGSASSSTSGSSAKPGADAPANPYRKIEGGAVPAQKAKHSTHDFFTENRAKADEVAAIDTTSMTSFISTGGRFPILVVTCDRTEMLRRTLSALVQVRGVTKEDIYVVQDGAFAPIKEVLDKAGVRYHQKDESARMRGGIPQDGAERIATHYGYALKHVFSSAFPNAPAVIVVEDDFLFAPDFYEYFHAVAPAIEADPTLWLASAWNDNGFDYLVADPFGLRRTRYFPGLGWLLPRRLFVEELSSKWPNSHWDHWMRDPGQHRNRDIIFPEIPRDYHAGVKGTFMDGNTHNRYFGSIAMQADPEFTWDTPIGAAAIEDLVLSRYDARIRRLVSSPDTKHLSTVGEIGSFREGVGVVWYDCPPNEPNHDKMRAVAGFFGIWHEGARGSRDGVHELWWLGTSKLVLVNAHPGGSPPVYVTGSIAVSPLRSLMPKGQRVIEWSEFLSAARPQAPRHGDLFGAITSSPLAHLDGGADANGAPDLTPADQAAKKAGGDAPGVVVYTRESGWDHESDTSADHAHSHFMGDLRLSPSRLEADEPRGGGGAGGKAPADRMSRIGALPDNVHVVPSKLAGLSCTAVCAAYKDESGDASEAGSWSCSSGYLPVVNDCSSLRAAFDCASCGDSIGSDQPAMVHRSAPPEKGPGSCLVNGDPTLFSCDGSWAFALRLCPCETAA